MACIKAEESRWDDGSSIRPPSQEKGQKSILQIYTDWANHYLEKGRHKRHISNLQSDVVDGVIIADVIEAVTGKPVAGLNRRPQANTQSLQNVSSCLNQLLALGVSVDEIDAGDIVEGKLKPILSLFFQLSRHKQLQQKRKRAETDLLQANNARADGRSFIMPGKSALAATNGGLKERQPADNKTRQSLLQKPSSATSSRSGSPASATGNRSRLSNPRSNGSAMVGLSRPGSRTPQTHNGGLKLAQSKAGSTMASTAASHTSASNLVTTREKNKTKTDASQNRRASSSSGFSSARSEKSDSSVANEPTHTSIPSAPPAIRAPQMAAPDTGQNDVIKQRNGVADGQSSLPRRNNKSSMLQQPRSRGSRTALTTATKRRSFCGSQTSVASSTCSLASSIGGAGAGNMGSRESRLPSAVPTAMQGKSFSQLPRQRRLGQPRVDPRHQGLTVALVSPMPHTPEPDQDQRDIKLSSDDICQSDTITPAADLTDEIKYDRKPAECESVTSLADVNEEPAVNGLSVDAARCDSVEKETSSEDLFSLRPMQPILRLNQFALNRGLTLRRPGNVHGMTGYASDTETVTTGSRRDSMVDGYMSEDGGYTIGRNHPQFRYSSLPLGGQQKENGETAVWRCSDSETYGVPAVNPSVLQEKMASAAGRKGNHIDFKQISNTQWKRAMEGRRSGQDAIGQMSQALHDPRREHRSSTPVNSSSHELRRSSTPVGSSPHEMRREHRSATPDKHRKMENGGIPIGDADISLNPSVDMSGLRLPKQKQRKSSGSGVSASSNGSRHHHSSTGTPLLAAGASVIQPPATGLPPKDPEHRPRTKVKVSGSTQTTAELMLNADQTNGQQNLQQMQMFKSYSVSGTTAQQLSQSLRERLRAAGTAGVSSSAVSVMNGGGEGTFSTLPAAANGRERSPRRLTAAAKITDGSLSDSNYGVYMDPRRQCVQQRPNSSYTAYMGHQLARTFRGSMTEAESMESVGSSGSGLLSHLQQRSGQGRMLTHTWDPQLHSPRLCRSNSIRSTKSEKVYPSVLQRGPVEETYYGCIMSGNGRDRMPQPPSPTPSGRNNLNLQRSGNSNRTAKDDEVHGSSLSLVSNTSSIYSSAHEDKQAVGEMRRLRRDLAESQEKVQTLANQLTTNAHVVEAFEQSLTSMTKKLHILSINSEQKDKEIAELRRRIYNSGLNTTSSPSHTSADTRGSDSPCRGNQLTRQGSNESISSQSSVCSNHSQQCPTPDSPSTKKKKKKGWFSASPQLRSSFGKAFSRRKSSVRQIGDLEETSAPPSPASVAKNPNNSSEPPAKSPSTSETRLASLVDDLRRQLREKDTALTDLRLEALASHNQLEALKEAANRIRREMAVVRQENERLQRLISCRSVDSSRSSLNGEVPLADRPPVVTNGVHLSNGSPPLEVMNPAQSLDTTDAVLVSSPIDRDERTMSAVILRDLPSSDGQGQQQDKSLVIGSVTIGRKTSWQALDDDIRTLFKEYVFRLDPDQSLGIGWEAIREYQLGDLCRPLVTASSSSDCSAGPPELLPWGYAVGDVSELQIMLSGHQHGSVEAFVFENLVPKAVVQRYISALLEQRRVVLSGQSGTGKTHLAQQLAEYLVACTGVDGPGSCKQVLSYCVQPGGGRDLLQFVHQLAERCGQLVDGEATNSSEDQQLIPQVVILDDLHHASAVLSEALNGLLSQHQHAPYVIGTICQSSTDPAGPPLPASFRWLPCANNVEPVRGYLARHLRRRLAAAELLTPGGADSKLRLVFEWIPRVWLQLNRFLETHSSADVTIGPRLFLNCPCELTGSQVWFTDVWNYSVVPYLMETVREGLLVYGRRASWHDPGQFVVDTYPWPRRTAHAGVDSLARLRPEDVGYDTAAPANGVATSPSRTSPAGQSRRGDGDPLLSMLMSLQEAANYPALTARSTSAATTPDGAPKTTHSRRAYQGCGQFTI